MKKKDCIWTFAAMALTALMIEAIHSRERRWIIRDRDKDIEEIRSILTAHKRKIKIEYMCNAGWAKAPDAWVVAFRCGNETYGKLCHAVNEKGIQIFNDNVGA